MKIYRIYTEETECIPSDVYDEDGYTDDRYDRYETTQTTIKYVDSYEKYHNFLKEVIDKNELVKKHWNCPIIKDGLTKRKYNKNQSLLKSYCDCEPIFVGNELTCEWLMKNYGTMYIDYNDYHVEEIEVE